MQTGKRGSVQLLVGIVVLALLVFAALILTYRLLARTASTPRAQSQLWRGAVSAPQTLTEAAQLAEPRIHAWAGDAQLTHAEAAWRPGDSWQEIETPPVSWTLAYYSAAQQALAVVTVADTLVFWTPPLEIESAPKSLSNFPPPYDIGVAWISFRAGGGEAFLRRYPEALIHFQLRANPDADSSSSLWIVAAMHQENHMEVRIDAQSGLVLNAE